MSTSVQTSVSMEHLKKWISKNSFDYLLRFMPILHQPRNFVMRFKMYLEGDEATTNTDIINDIQKLDDILSPLLESDSLLPMEFYNEIISLFDQSKKKTILEWAIDQRNQELAFLANTATLPNGNPDIEKRQGVKNDHILNELKIRKDLL